MKSLNVIYTKVIKLTDKFLAVLPSPLEGEGGSEADG
jgi:hypothetical protein